MDTDKNTQNITGEESSALHDAGVDLNDSGASPEGPEEINLDTAPDVKKDEDLKNIGIDFNQQDAMQNPPDLNILREKVLKQQTYKLEPQDVFSKEEAPSLTIDESKKSKDLEDEFKSAIGSSALPKKDLPALSDKISVLQSMLVKIKERLGIKKKEVKSELENLKSVKEKIAKDIENIKELEESEEKIQAELEKVDQIKGEIDSIEKEVEEELKM